MLFLLFFFVLFGIFYAHADKRVQNMQEGKLWQSDGYGASAFENLYLKGFVIASTQ
jgi:hypothetical protein